MTLDPARTALVIQDLQNDVIGADGAFAESGAPQHAQEQNVVANVRALAGKARKVGSPVIHVWYIAEPGASGLQLNAPLFNGIQEADALVRGTWGALPVDGLEPHPGDYRIEKMRTSAFFQTRLDTLLRGLGVETVVMTGAWTNMAVEHSARDGADAGFRIVVASDGTSTVSPEWQAASLEFALTNVATVMSCEEIAAALSPEPAVSVEG